MAFSDAIFAIIITLLVLDLRVPDVPPGRLLSGLLEQWPSYAAYLASYSYVAVVWLNHKAAFNRIQQVDRGLHWMNLFVLFSTALLPFPTAVVSDALQEHNSADQRVAVAFYALIGALLCATFLAFYHYLAKNPDLLKDQAKGGFFPVERFRALAGFVLYVLGGVGRLPGRAVDRPGHLRPSARLLRHHQRWPVPVARDPTYHPQSSATTLRADEPPFHLDGGYPPQSGSRGDLR
ncbi:TMEM175 family protein [Micromonospora taraxaci]|uniref:TMEM175 family protein n=1 Tax=Micromonospora taraxaci TaxID=1316803 RepID=UPI0034050659